MDSGKDGKLLLALLPLADEDDCEVLGVVPPDEPLPPELPEPPEEADPPDETEPLELSGEEEPPPPPPPQEPRRSIVRPAVSKRLPMAI